MGHLFCFCVIVGQRALDAATRASVIYVNSECPTSKLRLVKFSTLELLLQWGTQWVSGKAGGWGQRGGTRARNSVEQWLYKGLISPDLKSFFSIHFFLRFLHSLFLYLTIPSISGPLWKSMLGNIAVDQSICMMLILSLILVDFHLSIIDSLRGQLLLFVKFGTLGEKVHMN